MRDHGRGSSKVSSRAAHGGVLSSVDLCSRDCGGFSCALCSKPAQNGTYLRRFIRLVRMHFSRDRRVEQTDLTLTPASLVNAPALRMTRNRIVSFHTCTLTHVSTPQVQGSLCGGWACCVAAAEIFFGKLFSRSVHWQPITASGMPPILRRPTEAQWTYQQSRGDRCAIVKLRSVGWGRAAVRSGRRAGGTTLAEARAHGASDQLGASGQRGGARGQVTAAAPAPARGHPASLRA
jgi:hypothetical protein